MELNDHKYESAGLLKLPPHARDVAEKLLTEMPLHKLLEMHNEQNPDEDLLREYRAPSGLWPDIIKAALLAKVTYFLLNPKFNKEELTYLIKLACLSVDKPLESYSVKEVIEMSSDEYPILAKWLTKAALQLKQVR